MRHQRKNHLRKHVKGTTAKECSTPCGINGKTTKRIERRFWKRPNGAQRLAASTEKPPTRLAGKSAPQVVLNALRHQRKNHEPKSIASVSWPLCSTPCGINGKTTGQGYERLRVLPAVLNALRHQRKNHRVAVLDLEQTSDVLNALRHQRKNHMLSVYEFIHFTCVLNALRHQRKNHLRFSKPEAPRRGAQRLAASTEKPLTPKSTSIMRVHVLNALRRQRKNHFRRSGRVGVTHRVLNALRHQRKNHRTCP